MIGYGEATLIYVTTMREEDGSPSERFYTLPLKVKEVKTFSLNYYQSSDSNQRSMRLSKNIVVPKWATDDYNDGLYNYELMYVMYNGKRYRVREVLKYYQQDRRMILDIQEVR